MSTPEVARLLRAIADLIEASGSANISALTSEITQLAPKSSRKLPTTVNRREPRPDVPVISERLIAASGREEAFEILTEARLTRKELTELSRGHNIHVVKTDNIETIEGKIVESLVGSRLNSKAIRGDT